MQNSNRQKRFRVALWGVTHASLLFGRACALAEIPVVGAFDEDPERALRAALFLGISAAHTETELWESKPSLVVAGSGFPSTPPDSVVLLLGLDKQPVQGPRQCRATVSGLETCLPTEISSRLPALRLAPVGAEEAQQRAKEFLETLLPVFPLTLDP